MFNPEPGLRLIRILSFLFFFLLNQSVMFRALADEGGTTIGAVLLDAGNARLMLFSVSAFRTNTIACRAKS